MVLVNASITDYDGHTVTGLDKNQFHVWEDKVEQDIQYFSAEEVPDAIETILNTYVKLRESKNEDFLTAYRRVGPKPFKEALYAAA